MLKKTGLILLVLLGILALVRLGDIQVPAGSGDTQNPTPIKAIHYFSSSWPKSFWEDFENSQVDGDFAQIKADGFNTIILVIPWMGFETGFDDGEPEPSQLYDRLEWLLGKIDEAGLDYGLRVSFPHSFDPHNGIGNGRLCTLMFVDDSLREHWLQYLSRLSESIDQYRDTLKFAFFSWEDFFCPYYSIPNLAENQRLEMATQSGYQDWLTENFPKELVEFLYSRSFGSMSDVPLPQRKSPGFWLFLRFVDQFLIEKLLTPGRQVLPELAMEVRVDKDPIHSGDSTSWFEHDLGLSDTQMRGSYWGAYYGANNQGEMLNARQALRNFESMLNEVSDHGRNINHIVEQFNFADNTPGYVGHHAQIEHDELPRFLEGAAALLKEKSRGYGLWAYRDYVDSAIYNSSFELDLRGWDVEGQVVVITNSDSDKALLVQPGSVISQTFSPSDRFAGLTTSEQLTFCANFQAPVDPAHISLLLNGVLLAALDINEAGQHCTIMAAQAIKQPKVEFSISSDVEIQLDDLRLYSFVQILGVYDEQGRPGDLRDLIVQMNTEWLMD